MCDSNNSNQEKEKAKYELEKSIQMRNFEIDNFWKRGWFFGALLLALGGCYLNINDKKIDPSIISFLLFIVSLGQCLMNRGSKYWQERWEYKVKNRESKYGVDITKTKDFSNTERFYIDSCIRAKGENWFVKASRFSVSKITILIWDVIGILSGFLWIKDILHVFNYKRVLDCNNPYFIHRYLILELIIFTYIICTLLIRGAWSERLLKFKYKSNQKNFDIQLKTAIKSALNQDSNNDQIHNEYFYPSENYVQNFYGEKDNNNQKLKAEDIVDKFNTEVSMYRKHNQ